MIDKEWYKSSTVWGTILMIAAFVSGQFGFSLTGEQQAQVAQLMVVIATAIGELIGIILVITGRRKAGKEIKMLRLAKGLSPSEKGGFIDLSNKLFGEGATTLFSTGIFLGTREGRDILASIKAGVQSEKGKLLIEQWKKLGETPV